MASLFPIFSLNFLFLCSEYTTVWTSEEFGSLLGRAKRFISLQNGHTGSVAPPSSYSVGIKGSFSGVKADSGVKLGTHHSLEPSSIMHGVKYAISHVPSYCAPGYCLVFSDALRV
jgi:hypothetical protein